MIKFTIRWTNGKVSSFFGDDFREGKKAFHVATEAGKVLVPYAWYKDGDAEKVA